MQHRYEATFTCSTHTTADSSHHVNSEGCLLPLTAILVRFHRRALYKSRDAAYELNEIDTNMLWLAPQEYWTPNNPMQNTIILLIEQIVVALGGEFKLYLPQLIPHMLRVFMHDNSTGRSVTIKVSERSTFFDLFFYLIILCSLLIFFILLSFDYIFALLFNAVFLFSIMFFVFFLLLFHF